MTWLRRTRPALIVGGVLILAGSFLAARLTASNGENPDATKTANPLVTNAGSGPVFIGFVDSVRPPVHYGMPPVMQSGQIDQVFVKEGDHVNAGDPLYAFDCALLEKDLAIAEKAVAVANSDVHAAETKVKEHQIAIEAQQVSVEAAKSKVMLAERSLSVGKQQMRDLYKNNGYDPTTWDERLSQEVRILELEAVYQPARIAEKAEQAKLDALKKTDPNVLVEKARAGVAQAEAVEQKARTAVSLCTVRAKTAGIVEQVTIDRGTVFGISTRIPALWLIPDGPRVVRAEVEAEFAHRVTPAMMGRTVTIYDHNDPKLTYKGTLKRVSDSFLSKRSAGDNLLGNDTKVLEALVEVADYSPPGLPPLRIGQKVKVNFGP